MLSGERAFARATTGESLAAVLRDQPPEPSRSAPDVSPALDRLVARCLEKNPGERFQSARDLAYALRETISGSAALPVAVAKPPASRSDPAAVSLVGLAAVLAAFAAGWLLRPLFLKSAAPAFGRVVRLTHGPARAFGLPRFRPTGSGSPISPMHAGPTDVWVQFVAGCDPGQPNREVRPEPSSRERTSAASTSLRTPTQITFSASDAGGRQPHRLRPMDRAGAARRRAPEARGSRRRSALLAGRKADRLRAPGIGRWTLSSSPIRTARNPKGDLPHPQARAQAGLVIRRPRRLFPHGDPTPSTGRPRRSGGSRREAGRRSSSSAHRGSRSTRTPCRTGGASSIPPILTRQTLGLWWLPPSNQGPRPHDRSAPANMSSPGCRADRRVVPAALLDSKLALFQLTLDGTGEAPSGSATGAFGDADPHLSPGGDRLVWSSGALRQSEPLDRRSGRLGSLAADDRKRVGPDSCVFARRPASRIRVGPFRDAGHLDRLSRGDSRASSIAPKS